MDLINWVQTGGLPVKGERLQEMQTAYTTLNVLGNLAGNLTILSGCVVTGTSVSDGAVYINGEVLKFKAGFISDNVIIIENASAKEFENGEVKAMHYERYATFGTADTSWSWNDFKRPDPIIVLMAKITILEKKTAVFGGGGGMVFWKKAANLIPSGWAEVVDWRGRIPVGLDLTQTEFNVMDKMNGAKNKTLSIAELPRFRLKLDGKVPSNLNDTDRGTAGSKFSIDDQVDVYTDYIGNNQPFSIMNPYRVVLFIEYIG